MGLFSKKSSKDSDKDANPYAQNHGDDPYANPVTPYQQARANMASGGRPGGLPTGPSPRNGPAGGPPPPYSSPQMGGGNRYGSDKFGAGGYGSNRYEQGGQGPASAGGRSGGYGGLGQADSNDSDSKKDALFGGAANRYARPPPNGNANGPDYAAANSGAPAGRSYGGFGNDQNKSALLNGAADRYATAQQSRYGQPSSAGDQYGGYGEARELTEEEQEKLALENTSQEIRDVRQQSKNTLANMNELTNRMMDLGTGSLAKLGEQNERLHRTEQNLDIAASHSLTAQEKTAKLKSLNRSMFAVHVGNPLTKNKREAERDSAVLERHRMERDQRQATRADAYASNQRMEEAFRDMGKPQLLGASGAKKYNSNFIFVDDDDEDGTKQRQDEQDEAEIEEGIDQLSRNMKQIHALAVDIGQEVDHGTKVATRVAEKTDIVDDRVRLNREKLSRIH